MKAVLCCCHICACPGVGADEGEDFLEEADALPDDDELAAVGVGEGLEEDAVDDAEDGGGGADAQGQGEDRGEREAGRLPQLPERIEQILSQVLHRELQRNVGELYGSCWQFARQNDSGWVVVDFGGWRGVGLGWGSRSESIWGQECSEVESRCPGLGRWRGA